MFCYPRLWILAMTIEQTIHLIQVICGLALCFQTIEFLLLRKAFIAKGVWQWTDLKADFDFLPNTLKTFFNFLFNDLNFTILLFLRLIGSFLLIFTPHFSIILFLFFTTLFIAQRFRGAFNGGSDYMTLIILSALSFSAFFNTPLTSKGAIWYIAIQSATSYFLAGIVKIKQRNWHNGSALKSFLNSPNYNTASWIKSLIQLSSITLLLSWIIIFFEISFPLIFLINSPQIVIICLICGFIFHLINFYLFGLNRFLIIWTATYPALYFCTLR